MLDAKMMQERTDSFIHCDSKLLEITCRDFGDEVVIRLDDDRVRDAIYTFLECEYVSINHWGGEEKRGEWSHYEWTRNYTAHNFDVTIGEKDGHEYYVFQLDLESIWVTIYCLDLRIDMVDKEKPNDSTK